MNTKQIWSLALLLCVFLVSSCSSQSSKSQTDSETTNAALEAKAGLTSSINSDENTSSSFENTDLSVRGTDAENPPVPDPLAAHMDSSDTLTGDEMIEDEKARYPESWTRKGTWEIEGEAQNSAAQEDWTPDAEQVVSDSTKMAKSGWDSLSDNLKESINGTATTTSQEELQEVMEVNPGDTLVAAEIKEEVENTSMEASDLDDLNVADENIATAQGAESAAQDSEAEPTGNAGYLAYSSGTAERKNESEKFETKKASPEETASTSKPSTADSEKSGLFSPNIKGAKSYKNSPLYRGSKDEETAEMEQAAAKIEEMDATSNWTISASQPSQPAASGDQPTFNGKILSLNIAANSIMVKDPETSIAKIFKAKDKSILSSIKEGDLVSVIYNPGDTSTAEDIIVR